MIMASYEIETESHKLQVPLGMSVKKEEESANPLLINCWPRNADSAASNDSPIRSCLSLHGLVMIGFYCVYHCFRDSFLLLSLRMSVRTIPRHFHVVQIQNSALTSTLLHLMSNPFLVHYLDNEHNLLLKQKEIAVSSDLPPNQNIVMTNQASKLLTAELNLIRVLTDGSESMTDKLVEIEIYLTLLQNSYLVHRDTLLTSYTSAREHIQDIMNTRIFPVELSGSVERILSMVDEVDEVFWPTSSR
ncbi:hypothetical protein SCHPADRAFT_895043 [Schizopora paradoxa]|uniref:Uncharacterized protein n=1 Tax=Schizopora paradoxa TaxID=27342 RepID=A0A0H2R578_9AGAM|nr:hypothetical protein SCHPADRAFT_895043 [Schizopora paradoxa]